jgi:hypothetical protein
LRGRQGGNIAAILFHRAVRLNVQPGNRPQQRGFATTGGAKETDEFAPVNINADVIESGKVAEAFGEIANAKIGRGHGRSTWRMFPPLPMREGLGVRERAYFFGSDLLS